MLRAHVEHQLVGVEERLVLGIEVEVIHHAGATLAGLRMAIIRFEIAHCPLSMPRFACTHSWSCCRIGYSLRSGYPFQSSGSRMRFRSGCPSNLMPNMSKTSRSSQLAVGQIGTELGRLSPSKICAVTRMRSLRAKEYSTQTTSNCFSRLG